ncbi:hypothetical protein I551_7925 [Mycobacterium ulcerans str. Harvey]|uniref:Uncharacterized protein n=1 Tax=Mycobacterium ulcerans str. Harvey TaxID=1299332 RepID=A0ABP3A831_MYCUL|nr:hypothetical protein I551_7925 [Mycobacterium ulcerans str. Harvey]
MSSSGIEGYREYLARRDGEADLLHRRLATREEFFAAVVAEPIRSARRVDRQVFLRNLRRRRPEPGLDRAMLFLLATAKLNQAERFGVNLGETYGVNSGADLPPERVYVELEEHYHTRLLAYVLDMFGLPFQVIAPPLLVRQFVKMSVFLPDRLAFPIVGAARWRVASCSTSCDAPESNCSPTNRRWRPGSSASTARYSPTNWATSATARQAATPRPGHDAPAVPRCRTVLRSPDLRDKSARRCGEVSGPPGPAVRRRRARRRPDKRNLCSRAALIDGPSPLWPVATIAVRFLGHRWSWPAMGD